MDLRNKILIIAMRLLLKASQNDHLYRLGANNPARYMLAIVSAALLASLEEEENNENVTGLLDVASERWLWSQT
jgi:hypothetical protein